jgi:hypothetical protein
MHMGGRDGPACGGSSGGHAISHQNRALLSRAQAWPSLCLGSQEAQLLGSGCSKECMHRSNLYFSIALLCGVFVQLHLALFPAGGPFLPSLSVTLYFSIVSLCKYIFQYRLG